MKPIPRLQKRVESWKNKAKIRGDSLRYQRKEYLRIKKERDKYKKKVWEVRKQLEEERQKNSQPICNKEELIYISLQLFINASISFRAVPRVLAVLADYLGNLKVPCTQTIINWVSRLSIARIRNTAQLVGPIIGSNPFSNGFIWIIDISIGISARKILTVLALNANHHLLNMTAPTLQTVKCIAVSVSSYWNGEKIADFLQKVISVIGKPTAYLKDGGTDLAKAVRILGERSKLSPSIADISHIVANILKHEYQGHPMFNTFITACGKASKKLKQTILACFAPPKTSTKARFMNLHRLVKWASQLLKHSPRGRASNGSILSKLRASLDELPKCKAFINRFLRDTTPLLECQRILKNKGLSYGSYQEIKKLIGSIPLSSSVRSEFTSWLDEQILLAKNLGLENAGMPITSDNIES
ncbi:MAG: hypothetical protein GY739_06515, partial [Mesoflavibacter sp.]|nr:hypothetical protein [Mesoflavibacter sp.]